MKIYNTLNHKEEEFKLTCDRLVRMYVCGPTVYGPDHLGHARTYIFFDFLRRFLLAQGFKVKFVQNITDVGSLIGDEEEGEDKIEKKAKEEGKSPEEIARYYEAEHFKDLESLNVLKPDESPRATDYIEEIISYIKVLIEKGYAYEADGDIYFDVAKLKSYGELSKRNLEEMVSGTRVKEESNKKHPADFALWKKADSNHLQKWSSPWGEGYPGWHIECSVMSTKLLGQPFDLHGSSVEQIFPHHENELAQARAYDEKNRPLANFWIHGGMLDINGQKMAKSTGNFLTVKDILKKYDADTIRLAFLATFWRKPYNWEEEAVNNARKLKDKLVVAKEKAKIGTSNFKEELDKILDDNFNTPEALTLIYKFLDKMTREDFEYLEKVFGLKLEQKKINLTSEQEKMVEERKIAREKGDFKRADEIRKKLLDEGIVLQDEKS